MHGLMYVLMDGLMDVRMRMDVWMYDDEWWVYGLMYVWIVWTRMGV